MPYIVLDSNNEIVGVSFSDVYTPDVGYTAIFVVDISNIKVRGGYAVPGTDDVIIIPGTILTAQQILLLQQQSVDRVSRKQKIIDEISTLIGLPVLSLTDAQRWKLVAAVFYKLGVINSSGVINNYDNWVDI